MTDPNLNHDSIDAILNDQHNHLQKQQQQQQQQQQEQQQQLPPSPQQHKNSPFQNSNPQRIPYTSSNSSNSIHRLSYTSSSSNSTASSRKPSLLRTNSSNNPSSAPGIKRNSSANSVGSNSSLSKKSTNQPGSTAGNQVMNSREANANSTPPGINRSQSSSAIKPRSRSSSNHHTSQNSQYLAQEKAYLKKLRNQFVDDYYTKGITGANEPVKNINEEDESSAKEDNGDETDIEDENESGDEESNANFLAAIDDNKYQIDYTMALQLMKNSNVNLKKITNLSTDDNEDPTVIERLEWQSMLTSVLTGDVVKSEKRKIININNPDNSQENFLHATYKESLWFGIRAKILNRTEDEQRKIVLYRRTLVDQLIDDIMNFEVSYDDPTNNPIRNQVKDILDRYDDACSLWKTLDVMRNDKPACRSEEFQNRVDALTSWLSITDAINRETTSLRLWIGNDELDITKSPVEMPSKNSVTSNSKIVKKIFDEDNKSLAERLMKDKDVQTIFKKRIFRPISPWMIKSKDTYIRLGHVFETMKLPDYLHDLIQICVIPMKLIKEIIIVRLSYAVKLQNPTLMMIDQMLEDFKSYITIALEVKSGISEYRKPDVSRNWLLSDLFDSEISNFDTVILRCVRYFLVLLNKKLLDSSKYPTTFRTFKEPEELEEAWSFLSSLGNYIEGGSVLVAEEITLLTSRLIHRLLQYFSHQIRLSHYTGGKQDLARWYSSTSDIFGQLRRKLARFTGEISREFTNSLVFELPLIQSVNLTKNLLDVLKSTNHFLVYTGTVETQGTYFFASNELMGKEHEILKIINGSYIGLDSKVKTQEFSDLLNLIQSNTESQIDEEIDDPALDYAYILALCPMKPIVWEGEVVNVNIDSVPITDLKNGQLLVISKLPYYELHTVRDKFLDVVGDVFMNGRSMKPIEQRCSLAKVHQELTKTNRVFFRMCLAVLDSVKILREKIYSIDPKGENQALVNNFFIYARDYGKNSIKNLDSNRKSTIIMKLIQLSIDWVSFICDDCIPTDRKTFRWCVLALEFAMDMTRGFNVLVLSESQFDTLKIKVSRCMSLLISHFDIMGARSSEAERNRLLKWTSQRNNMENTTKDDAYLYEIYQEEVMLQIEEIEAYRKELSHDLQSIGKVIDTSDSEYQFVTLLASSFSSVSIRWQKGKYIGGGTFGQVFAAINLDTGGIMAVKEIRFHDSQSIKSIVPLIKEEMTVLEMLNHPNVVQYFGVEVHRDKVYIFMEYCEGGSLSGLLTHGRIEDEMVVQVYTLQMLEGLAYLHQSGVVHRDIKPENILLDHNGVIKFVDFGAAKVIANTGRTRASIKPAGSAAQLQDNGSLNSMTGTPMYMSPEVITGASTDRNGVVDIWSLGCCVLEMATGRRPWANLDNEWAIMYHIAAGHKPQLPNPDQLSEQGRKFLSRCLEHDPTRRPSAVELLNDPWMVSIRQLAFGGSEVGSTPNSENGDIIN
ncbi:unnamed protein product [Candida verbasci]|uniref:MAP kinase kinase kinase n=1 Tax=Candida verbasci TaxID=1227364 RepID=A0A9W4TYG2_9ASCO|nr:unnamed protein product [Candida verbasci]